MTNKKIVDQCNELARKFYKLNGFVAKADFKFYDASHIQEKMMWGMAVTAYEHIGGTEVDNILNDDK